MLSTTACGLQPKHSPSATGGYATVPDSSARYHMQQGKVHAGLTRAVWELNEVREGWGGTRFLSGSHKR